LCRAGAGWYPVLDCPARHQARPRVWTLHHRSHRLLIFSANANDSRQIHREIERAVSKGVPIIPLRIEEVVPTKSMEYFLGAIHWLDALTPPLEKHLQQLTEAVKALLQIDVAGRGHARKLVIVK
jgi:hypothetical protein